MHEFGPLGLCALENYQKVKKIMRTTMKEEDIFWGGGWRLERDDEGHRSIRARFSSRPRGG